MITITCSAAAIKAWRHGRVQHPAPRIQGRLEALYVRSQRVAARAIPRLCGLSQASVHRDLKAYVTGGMAPWKHLEPRRPRRTRPRHRATSDAAFRQQPPAPVAAAAARIEALTGVARTPPPGRQCWPGLGMKPRQVGLLPAKADVEAQETLQKTVWSRGEPKPRRAHGWCGAWMPHLWCGPPAWGASGVSPGSW